MNQGIDLDLDTWIVPGQIRIKGLHILNCISGSDSAMINLSGSGSGAIHQGQGQGQGQSIRVRVRVRG